MEAKELVGKWVESEVLTDEINAPAGTAFKVVGYTTYGNCIVDAGSDGWSWKALTRSDVILEQREFYRYLSTENVSKVYNN